VSDIVVREVKAHISRELEEPAARLRNALNNFSKMRGGVDKEKAATDLKLNDNAADEVDSQWAAFADQTAAVELRASDTMDGAPSFRCTST
jgi:hypothetical protein